jgi:hypothetical protein
MTTLLRRKPSAVGTVLLVLAALALPSPALATVTEPWYTTSGRVFVDRAGTRVVLRGVNVHPSHPAPPVAALGANLARIFIRWSDIEPSAPVGDAHGWSAARLARIDTLVADLGALGVAVEIDLHQCGWSSYWAPVRTASCNAGIPDWFYADGRFPLTLEGRETAIAAWWTTEAARSHAAYLPFVRMMVERYSSFPNVIGFGLFNEPPAGALGSTTAATNAILAWQRPVADAVRSLDPLRAIFFMCRDDASGVGTADLSLITSVGHTVLDWHHYANGQPEVTFDPAGDNLVSATGGPIYMHEITEYTGTIAAHKAIIGVVARRAAEAKVPLFVGEWGARRGTLYVQRYQSQLFRAFDARGLSWARWSLSRTDGFGLENPDGSLTDSGRQLRRLLTS